VDSDSETMIRDLLTLPLRIGLCATRLGLRVADRLIDVAMRRPHAPAGSQDDREEQTFQVDIAVAEPSATDEMPSAPPPAPEVAFAPPPAHVSTEPQFVESFAERGAEEGAGAAVHVDEPWEGYRRMTAREVTARLSGASREALAAVALYERAHRRRATVLATADRQLRLATAAAQRPS
jgi:hypothetical protein